MKSLEARQAQRAKQKAKEAEERGLSKDIVDGGDKEDDTDESPVDDDGEEGDDFDAKDWLNDTAANISANLGTLSDEELLAIESAEKADKKRSSVADAVSKEKKKREDAGSKWGEGR